MIDHGEVLRIYGFIAVPKACVYFLQIFIKVGEKNILYSNGVSEESKPFPFLYIFLSVYLEAETKFKHFEYTIFLKRIWFWFCC